MKSRNLFITIAIIGLLLSLLVVSCAQQAAPAPAPAPKPAQPAPAAPAAPVSTPASPPAKVIQLKFAEWTPPTGITAKCSQRWAENIEKLTGGRVKITTYFSESLLKTADVFRGTQSGLADISYYSIGTDPGVTELNRVIILPLLGINSYKMGTAVYEKLLSEFPQMQAEWKGLKVYAPRLMPGSQVHATKKEIKTPADLKGMKVIARAQWAEVLRNVGGAPVELGVGDWYTALSTGLAEGQITHYAAIYDYKTIDLLKYHTDFGEVGCGVGLTPNIFNLNTWNSLPPDIQKIFEDSSRDYIADNDKGSAESMATGINYAKNKGHTFYYPTKDDLQKWYEGAKATQDKWINDNEAKGLPAKAIFNRAKALIAEYEKNGKL